MARACGVDLEVLYNYKQQTHKQTISTNKQAFGLPVEVEAGGVDLEVPHHISDDFTEQLVLWG